LKRATRIEGDTNGTGEADFKLELMGLIKRTEVDFFCCSQPHR